MKHSNRQRPALTAARRRWLYSIAAAAGTLAVLYGIITVEQLPAWLQFIAALLGVTTNAMALAYTKDTGSQ